MEAPSPKRRKISADAESPPPLPAPFSDYIVLARAKVTAQSTDLDLTGAENTVHEVNLKDIAHNEGTYEVSVTVGRGTRGKSVLINDVSPGDLQVLEYAQKLESVAKYKAPGALPLACSYATVRQFNGVIELEVCISWENTVSLRDKVDPILLELLACFLPPTKSIASEFELWEPRQFYDNVHVPEKSEANSAHLKIPALESQLFPFQRRAVRWLLSREGMVENSNGSFRDRMGPGTQPLPPTFEKLTTWAGQTCYVDHVLGVVATDQSAIKDIFASPKGGILADEMGLGKTLEIISLICLHPKPAHEKDYSELLQSSATLIITPPTILEQWKDELREHAPALRVYHYQGVKEYKKSGDELIDRLLNQDVVLTTYNVISKEVHHIAEKPDRNLRNGKREESAKSPLTQIMWWRQVLDEAQLVESGLSAAATVARLIPRRHAWAVTGTPLRKGHRDLFGLFVFLRYSPWCYSPRLWDRLITHHRPRFREMLGTIAMRHSKDFVREDLQLPPQSRHTITIPFTAVEEQHYAQLFQEFCDDCGLDATGAPLEDDWDPESPAVVERMRTWLTRLRQTCLHPEVGGRNRRALGRNTNRPLRTVQEVLDAMIDQTEGQLRTTQRGQLVIKLRRGQLNENAKKTQDALNLYQEVYEESRSITKEIAQQITKEYEAKKEKEKEAKPDDDEANLRANTLKARERSLLEVQHIAIFFSANAHFQLKSSFDPESQEYQELEAEETKAYEAAKRIRTYLLIAFSRHVNKFVMAVRANISEAGARIPIMEEPSEYGGIESRKVFDKLHHYCRAMNAQAEYIQSLQQKMTDFLSQALIDEDEGVELQGDEYENSTKHQDEMYAYMEALRALLADRTEAITGQENMLIKQEFKAFERLAKEGQGPSPDVMLKLLVEREKYRIKVRELGCLRGFYGELRQMASGLQWQETVQNSSRAKQEMVILEGILQHVQRLNAAQTKALSGLEQQVNQFRDTMNSRLEYYRALQKLSDQVAPYREETVGQPLDEHFYNSLAMQEAGVLRRAASLSARLRYLAHMKTESDEPAARVCVICTDQYENGVITQCGHTLCKECLLLWIAESRRCPVCKTILNTKSVIEITYKPAEIAVQAESPSGSTSSSTSTDSDRRHDQSIYSDISTLMMNEIKNIDLRGPSYGSKIDFLCRHLLWLRQHDPGSKSIIFSQYREFIDVLARAFSEIKISCTRIDAKNGIEKFKAEPQIECFLLHAKGQSTGLNLVVASHVFLCEPLINTAIELQAIARVHRIGQHHPTNVWMYLIADTVEESIYDISVTRRLAHMKSKDADGTSSSKKGKGKSHTSHPSSTAGTSASASALQSGTSTPHPDSSAALQETAIDTANSLELQAADLSRLLAAGKSGGELVDKEDLWSCLFGRVQGQRRRVQGQVAGAVAAEQPANSEIARLLRSEAAEGRARTSAEDVEMGEA